jgi:hypothetical protein
MPLFAEIAEAPTKQLGTDSTTSRCERDANWTDPTASARISSGRSDADQFVCASGKKQSNQIFTKTHGYLSRPLRKLVPNEREDRLEV